MKQGEMDSSRQKWLSRSGRLKIELGVLRSTRSESTSASKSTDCFKVSDIGRKQCHMIFVHRVDYRPKPSPSIGKVVKFSKRCYAPCRAKKLWLATPSYYRDEETLPPGIADPDESTLKKNLTPWMRNRIPYGNVKAEAVFSPSREPWVYCTSHFPSHRVYRELKSKFSDEYDYDAATEIKDVDAFAMWLGIDFALQIDKSKHLKMEVLDRIAYWASNHSIDTFVYVYHGPVHYENESGVIVTDDDLVDIHGSVRACFSKRTEFEDQSEYRFAVSSRGIPCDEIFKLGISEDLRQLTSPMR